MKLDSNVNIGTENNLSSNKLNNQNRPSRKEVKKAINTLLDVRKGLEGKSANKKEKLMDKILDLLNPKQDAKDPISKMPNDIEVTTNPSTEPSSTETTSTNETISSDEHCMESSETKNIQTELAQIKEPGQKGYQEIIRDLIEPGTDGKIGEKELQVGLIKFSLYQHDTNTLDQFSQSYEKYDNLNQALQDIVDKGLIEEGKADWIRRHTASAAETNRDLNEDKTVDVELNNFTRYEYENMVTWAERNLAHIIHGNVIVE